jgi:hypothetical protein
VSATASCPGFSDYRSAEPSEGGTQLNDKLYIHEYIEIIGHHRADYMHHMTANWSPKAQVERNQKCYGVWGTVGTTRRWPEVVNLWEEDGFDGMATSFRHELNHAGLQDPALAEWWAEAANFRRSGEDKLLIPAPWTQTIDELCAAGNTYEAYAHETFSVDADTAWTFTDLVRERASDALAPHGWTLIGAFVTAMVPDNEVVLLWGIETWEGWADLEKAQRSDAASARWYRSLIESGIDWTRILLVDAPLSPLRTGRQPQVEDRGTHQLPTRDPSGAN